MTDRRQQLSAVGYAATAIVLRELGRRALRRSIEHDVRIATFSSVTVSAVGIVQTWRRRAAKRKAAALAGELQP